MKQIWKFPLTISGQAEVLMPPNATVLKVECQGNQPCIWAMVVPVPKEQYHLRIFQVFGTGDELPEWATRRTYIATFQQGPFVWHVFERFRDVN